MTWQSNPYSIPLFVTALILMSFALHVSRRRSGLSVTLFLLFMTGIAAQCVMYGIELLSAQPATILFWAKARQPLVHTLPILWVLFVVAYTRQAHRISPGHVALLLLVPAATTTAALTNDLHFLYWAATGAREYNGLVYFDARYGPIFWIGVAYAYILLLGTAGLLLSHLRRSPGLLRGQISNLLLSMLIPWAAHIVSLLGWDVVRGLDLLPYGLALMGMSVSWSLYRYRLFDLVPTAYDAVVKSMSDAVIVLDARDHVIDVNPAAQRLLARSPEELLGSPAHHALDSTWEGLLTLLDARATTGEVRREADGQTEYFDVRLSPLRDLDQLDSGRVVVLRNATQHRRSEETIRQYARDLEERNRDLDTFTDTVAHDLRAPLHLIIGYAGLLMELEEDRLPTEVMNYLLEIERTGYRMNAMVKNLLIMAQLREGPSQPGMVEVIPVVQSALERFQDSIQSRQIRVEIDPDLPPAYSYAIWLEEIFANLIGNAINYIGSDNGAPRIRVGGSIEDGMVRYEVQDNGLGISPEVQDKLFEMFTRFHPGEGSGFGMGLSIVQRIVTRLNGQVGVESALGQGSTFWFSLPAAPPAASDGALDDA